MKFDTGIVIILIIGLLLASGCISQRTDNVYGQQDPIPHDVVFLPLVDEETLVLNDSDLNDSDVWVRKGKILNKNGQFSEALQMFDHAIRLNESSVTSWAGRGGALLELDRYNESLESYNTAIELDPSCSEAYKGRGIGFYLLEKYPEAFDAFNMSLKLNDQDMVSWAYQGMLFNQTGAYHEALESYNRSLEIDPDNYLIIRAKEDVLAMIRG